MLVEKKKETITESAGRQQKKKIGKSTENKLVPSVVTIRPYSFYELPSLW